MQVQALQVGNVAGHVDGKDLTLAVGRNTRTADKSLDDETAVARPIAFLDQGGVRWKLLHVDWKRLKGLEILLGKVIVHQKPANEHVSWRHRATPPDPLI